MVTARIIACQLRGTMCVPSTPEKKKITSLLHEPVARDANVERGSLIRKQSDVKSLL